jgi:RNA polymerase sigma-70 factor (ECF subfamily)
MEGPQSTEKEIPHKNSSMVEKAMESRNDDHHARVVDEDAVLLVRAGRGDRAAFDRLYHKYYRVVTSYLARRNGCHDMLEDLVQEVFTRLWQNRKQFRGRSTVKSYICGIARNVLSNHKKRLLLRNRLGHDGLTKYFRVDPDVSSCQDFDAYANEFEDALERAVSRLTSKQRQAVRLCYFETLSSAFRGRLRQAHKHLRRLLSKTWAGENEHWA